jgi:ketosteroid isomerase-like protein
MNTAEQELIDISKRWDEAMVTNDVDEIGKFMSDDWIIIGADGITSKDSFLQIIANGTLTHNRMDSDELQVRVHGNSAAVISRGTSAGDYNKEPFSLYEWSTSMFINNGKNWLCILTMLTPAKI